MILQTASQIQLDGIPLPGIFQSLSVGGEVIIDSGNSAGNNKPRKVMRGFGDKAVSLSLLLVDGEGGPAYAQLEALEKLFHNLNSGAPRVFTIANEHLIARGIGKVVFKSLSSAEHSASNLIEASLSFEEFIEAGYDEGR